MYSIEEDIQNHRMVITSKYMKKNDEKKLRNYTNGGLLLD